MLVGEAHSQSPPTLNNDWAEVVTSLLRLLLMRLAALVLGGRCIYPLASYSRLLQPISVAAADAATKCCD